MQYSLIGYLINNHLPFIEHQQLQRHDLIGLIRYLDPEPDIVLSTYIDILLINFNRLLFYRRKRVPLRVLQERVDGNLPRLGFKCSKVLKKRVGLVRVVKDDRLGIRSCKGPKETEDDK